MTEMPVSRAREQISEIVGRARYAGEPTVLTHHGQQVAVVISIDEYRALRAAHEDYWRGVETALAANKDLKERLARPVDPTTLTLWDEIR